MQRSDIHLLLTDKSFTSRLKGMSGKLSDDLTSHVILIMYELADEHLEKILNMNAYAYMVAYAEYKNRNSRFNKQMGTIEAVGLPDHHAEVISEKVDEEYSIVESVIKMDLNSSIAANQFPVQHELFKVYLEKKTIRATADFFNIPKSTVHRLIQSYKQRIKLNIENR